MIIYTNGDSFVSGVELADDILPEHPGYNPYSATDEQRRFLMKWMTRTYDETDPLGKLRSSNLEKITNLEYQRAWPKKIQDNTGVPVINHAQGGSSFDRIARVTISDLINLKKTEHDIIAIIGTTCPSRSEIASPSDYYHHLDFLGLNTNWEQIATSYRSSHQTGMLGNLIDYKIHYEKNYHQLVNVFKNIVLIQDFCKLNEIKLYWVASSVNILKEVKVESEIVHKEDLINLIDHSNFRYDLDMRQVASQSASNQVLCPALHFSEKIHDEVADRLMKILCL